MAGRRHLQEVPALGFGYGGATGYALSLDWMLPHATAFNPFATADPRLTRMLNTAGAAPAYKQPALCQDVMRFVVDRARFVSVLRMDGLYAYNARKVTGFTATPSYIPDLAWSVAPR
ncbi:hypothetical protein [Streptomyces sp. NPDC020362]|uniref:hypothetical protein n=1 Tax=unclassified Streptomyces TaxID=2593676 RepID=UPI000A78C69A